MPSRRLATALLVLLLLALFVVRGVLSLRLENATADEPLHLHYGERALKEHTFVRDDAMLNSKMPVSVLNAVPSFFAERSGGELPGRRKLVLDRIPTLLLGALLGWLVFSWSRALFGRRAAFLALFLYTFCPNVLAHSRLITTDVATALGMFAAAYAFWRYRRQPTRGRLLVAALAFGLAQLSKVTAVFLLPIFFLVLVCEEAVRERAARQEDRAPLSRSARRFAGRLLASCLPLLALCGAALVVVDLGFLGEGLFTPLARYPLVSERFQQLAAVPLLRDLPLPLPAPYMQGIDMVSRDTAVDFWSYLHGHYSLTGFWSYFLVAMLLKVPVSTLLLLAAAGALWATGKVRVPGAEADLLVPVVFLFVYFSCFFKMQIGLRYLLPIFPFLFVFLSRVALFRPWRRAYGVALGALLVWNAAASLWIHPHYLAYFNELIGGPRHGYHYLIDADLDWGQDNDFVRDVWAKASPVPVTINPIGPTAGRLAVGASTFVGLDPEGARVNAWLRENFAPVDTIGYSWLVFDVDPDKLKACCMGYPQVLPERDGNLARFAKPIGGTVEGKAKVRFLEKLNDQMLDDKSGDDAARTTPPQADPVAAWFGIDWQGTKQTIGRIVAYPGTFSRGNKVLKFLAIDYVLQYWDGAQWLDIPGTRVSGNHAPRVEHRFPPIETDRIRLLIERERDVRGKAISDFGYRATCLEIAAFRE